MLKFAHIADCHLGGWRQPEIQKLNMQAFEKTIDACIKEKVNFLLITGDLFDTAMPPVEVLKETANKLRELKEAGIPCYFIAGSHDYSVSGKTFLHVLEKAGLCENIEKVEHNGEECDPVLQIIEKEDFILAGISGKKGELEKETIRKIKSELPVSKKPKIIALHTTLSENKTNEFMDGIECDELPKGFDYYALGHIHKPFKKEDNGRVIVYPGPLFPNNFAELEELENGSFVIVNFGEKVEVEWEKVIVKNIISIEITADGKTPELLTSEILGKLKKDSIEDRIVLLKVKGTLLRGKTSDVNFKEIEDEVRNLKCYSFLKNISGLESPDFKVNIEVKSENIEEIEKEVLKKQKPSDFDKIADTLLKMFEMEKHEGETSTTFENRLFDEFSKITGVELK